jgi:hypothetical protein
VVYSLTRIGPWWDLFFFYNISVFGNLVGFTI